MKNKIVVGADIGGTNSAVGLVSESGEILRELKFSTKAYDDADSFVAALSGAILLEVDKISDTYELCAVGLGAPNGNYYSGMVEEAPNLKWKGNVNLSAMFSKALNVPTVITNDANAAAIGEMLYGGARGLKNFVVITLGTGLGSGIVVNGELLYGHTGFAGEIGHRTVQLDGRPCTWGKRGCLEAYVSARGFRQTAMEMLTANKGDSVLRQIPLEKLGPKSIAKAANEGDQIAREVFEWSGKVLGRQLADTIAYLSPEKIFLYGGIAYAGELLLAPTRNSIEDNLLNIFKGHTQLEFSRLQGKSGGILGAGALAWKTFCSSEYSVSSEG